MILKVKAAHQDSVPFVPVCVGYRSWSTVGINGFILGLNLSKELATALSKAGQYTGKLSLNKTDTRFEKLQSPSALGNGDRVGVIRFCLGGGISTLTTLGGFGCEDTVSARIVTAPDVLLETNAERNSDLYCATEGAGQVFRYGTWIKAANKPSVSTRNTRGKALAGIVHPVERAE